MGEFLLAELGSKPFPAGAERLDLAIAEAERQTAGSAEGREGQGGGNPRRMVLSAAFHF